jgi:cellulose synthase/poly-beta-1,6-N-acetylglucosamine synthase-like glycosyltransferase
MTPSDLLANGNYVQAVISLFTSVMGVWFYTLILFTITLATYIKTENTTIPLILMIGGMMLFRFVLGVSMAVSDHVFWMIAVFAFAMLLASIFLFKKNY